MQAAFAAPSIARSRTRKTSTPFSSENPGDFDPGLTKTSSDSEAIEKRRKRPVGGANVSPGYCVSTGKFDGFLRRKYSRERADGIILKERGFWPKSKTFSMLVEVESVVPSRPNLNASSTKRRMLPNAKTVCATLCDGTYGEMMMAGTRKPGPPCSSRFGGFTGS